MWLRRNARSAARFRNIRKAPAPRLLRVAVRALDVFARPLRIAVTWVAILPALLTVERGQLPLAIRAGILWMLRAIPHKLVIPIASPPRVHARVPFSNLRRLAFLLRICAGMKEHCFGFQVLPGYLPAMLMDSPGGDSEKRKGDDEGFHQDRFEENRACRKTRSLSGYIKATPPRGRSAARARRHQGP